MKKALIVVAAVVAVLLLAVIVVGISGVGSYNRLVSLQQGVEKQWAQVENVYQRRYDLIPNLVATVQGAANFEKSTLEAVVQARASVGSIKVNPADPSQFARFQQAQDSLSSALSRLLVVVERYPDLKSNSNFLELQAQLEGTENRIAVERGRFNEIAQQYNTAIKQFPTMIVAAFGNFHERPYFTATPAAETAPKVEFNFGPAQSTNR